MVARGTTAGVDDFQFNVSVDGSVASVERAAVVPEAQFARSTPGAAGTTVELVGVDVGTAGDPVTLGRVTRRAGETTGEATLSLAGELVVDGTDTPYAVAATDGATVRVVEQAAPDVGGNGDPATDPDGDGRFEDVNGDGSFNVLDVSGLLDEL